MHSSYILIDQPIMSNNYIKVSHAVCCRYLAHLTIPNLYWHIQCSMFILMQLHYTFACNDLQYLTIYTYIIRFAGWMLYKPKKKRPGTINSSVFVVVVTSHGKLQYRELQLNTHNIISLSFYFAIFIYFDF